MAASGELILGIESSCDETAAAVVRGGREILSSVVHSQIDEHRPFGGVVPEIAARAHVERILPVIDEALRKAGCTHEDLDAIAVYIGAPIDRRKQRFKSHLAEVIRQEEEFDGQLLQQFMDKLKKKT